MVPDSADPSSCHLRLIDTSKIRSWSFLSTLRVAGTEHMLAARYDMMVAQPGAVKKP
jgi:hypothetical protein